MQLNQFSGRALTLMILLALLAAGLALGNQMLLFNELDQSLGQLSISPEDTAEQVLQQVQTGIKASQARQWTLFMPILGGAVLLLALIFWGVLRGSARKLATASRPAGVRTGKPKEKQAPAAKRDPRVDQRLYLHLVSILQREGRLMDFLFEDLSLYEDAQIGAAVRPIHENCSRILRKSLAPKPVMDAQEDENVTVAAGFDATAVKLTGNVTGEPPFTGILRHSGWRAAKLELPTLSGSQNPRLIAPAEVEL